MQKKKLKRTTDSLAEESNCNCQQRTLSQELAEWIRLHREHWYEDSDIEWNRLKQFVFTFLGSSTFFLAIHIYNNLTRTVPAVELVSTLFVGYYLSLIVPAFFFGAILAWKPRKTGPIRLYIAGITLPALSLLITIVPFRFLLGVFQ